MPSCVSLFSGVGGLDYGLEQAGFDMVFSNDMDVGNADTYRANMCGINPPRPDRPSTFAGCMVVDGDIRNLGSEVFAPFKGADLVAGGPPCQPFTSAGKQLGLMDPRGGLYREFLRVVSIIKPKYVLMENVRGLITARGLTGRPGEVVEEIVRLFGDLGYGVAVGLLNAADYGLPQRRVRFFLAGVLGGDPPSIPVPTHGKGGHPKAWVPMSVALLPDDKLVRWVDERGVPRCEATYANERQQSQLAAVPVGKGVRSVGRVEPTRPGGHWGYKQTMFVADPLLPARTIIGTKSQDWIRLSDGRHRRIVAREAIVLQGFPIKWEFHPYETAFWRQVGNAVPPLLGLVMGKALLGGTKGQGGIPEYMKHAMSQTAKDQARNSSARTRCFHADS